MTKDEKDIEVLNPRYEGATPGMVVKTLFCRVKKADLERTDESENAPRPMTRTHVHNSPNLRAE